MRGRSRDASFTAADCNVDIVTETRRFVDFAIFHQSRLSSRYRVSLILCQSHITSTNIGYSVKSTRESIAILLVMYLLPVFFGTFPLIITWFDIILPASYAPIAISSEQYLRLMRHFHFVQLF